MYVSKDRMEEHLCTKTPVKSRRDQQLQIIWISKPQNHVKEVIIIDGNKR